MEKIKISHEVPISMLEESRRFNDYDYALVHLFEKNKEYLDFFKASLKMGREVILDNSIFELGEAFEACKFAYWVKELSPTKYIIPDVLGDSIATVLNMDKWLDNYGFLPGIKIGVVQGSTYEELTACYKAMSFEADELAICFHYPCYEQSDLGKMHGRINLIDKWLSEDVIRRDIKHHLLGCSLPQEFNYYRGEKYSFINSLDTSNPIVHGIKRIEYDGVRGLQNKEKILLADLLNVNVEEKQHQIINYNIRTFKQIVNGSTNR